MGAAAGYYLRGRVFDAATLAPIAKADLTLIAGSENMRTQSGTDGTYTIGPIPSVAHYRLLGAAEGMEAFEHTDIVPDMGETPSVSSVIGDVPLYRKGGQTPKFELKLSSGDPVEPSGIGNATVDFIPTTSRTELTPSGVVSGAYAEAADTTLPNDLQRGATVYHARVDRGSLSVPAGALSWGSTYQVRVDAGPAFDQLQFRLSPVKDAEIQVVLRPSGSAAKLAVSTQQYFSGRIYDGVTHEQLKNYKLRIEYFDRVLEAKVDDDGRYSVGPLVGNVDYSVVVEADGYRRFISHNNAPGSSGLRSDYFDAFLYPQGVKAPKVNARFVLSDTSTRPSGTVRFTPAGTSNLVNENGAISGQLWRNSDDFQQPAVIREFQNGSLELAEGELVLGVRYNVTVFGVNNYQYTSSSFTAGETSFPVFYLDKLGGPSLNVVNTSNEGSVLTADGSLVIRFNGNIVLDPTRSKDTMLRGLNDGLYSIDSPDKNANSTYNTLVAYDSGATDPEYRGVTFSVSGDTLTIKWNREKGLETTDTADPIYSVTYSGLGNIYVRHAEAEATAEARSLTWFISDYQTVRMLAK